MNQACPIRIRRVTLNAACHIWTSPFTYEYVVSSMQLDYFTRDMGHDTSCQGYVHHVPCQVVVVSRTCGLCPVSSNTCANHVPCEAVKLRLDCFARDMTRSCVIWRIRMWKGSFTCGVSHVYTWHDAFNVWLDCFARDMTCLTHSYVKSLILTWKNSLIWVSFICEMTRWYEHSYVKRLIHMWNDSLIWDSFICEMTRWYEHPYVKWLIHMWIDSLIWVSFIWLIDTRRDTRICKMTHSHVTRRIHVQLDYFTRDMTRSCVTRRIRGFTNPSICGMTHSHVTRRIHVHAWMCHVTYIKKSHHIWMSPFTYECVMSHIYTSHATYTRVKSHIHESYHPWVIWSMSHVIPTNSSINPHALWMHHAVKRLSAHDSFTPWVISLMDESCHTHKLINKP